MRGLVGLVLGCVACTDAGPVQELLHNGGFEIVAASGFAAEWRPIDDNPGGQISVVTDPHLTGERALQWQIDPRNGFEYFVIQGGIPGTALVLGKTYAVTGSARFSGLGDIGFSQTVRGEGVAPSFSNRSEASALPTQIDTWEPFRFEFMIPPDTVIPATWEVVINVSKFTSAPLVVTVDDLSLHLVPLALP